MAGGGMHPPHPLPGSAPARTDNNVSYHYTNQPIWLQYDAGRILSQLFWNNSTQPLHLLSLDFLVKKQGFGFKRGV